MADWDRDSSRLRNNLRDVLTGVINDAVARTSPTVKTTGLWHRELMDEINVPNPDMSAGSGGIGARRLRSAGWRLSGRTVGPCFVATQAFEDTLQRAVSVLDALIGPGQDLSVDQLAAVIDLCAWTHAEWVRIDPFANGNGRTARLWANCIAMRYGLPAFVRLRPRPGGGYEAAAAEAMQGRWQATSRTFRHMLRETVSRRH